MLTEGWPIELNTKRHSENAKDSLFNGGCSRSGLLREPFDDEYVFHMPGQPASLWSSSEICQAEWCSKRVLSRLFRAANFDHKAPAI